MEPEPRSDKEIQAYVRRKSIIAFSVFVLGIVAAIAGWQWLQRQPRDGGALRPLRHVLNFNEKVNHDITGRQRLAPEFSKSAAVAHPRVNGDLGMSRNFDTAKWLLKVVNFSHGGQADTLRLSLADIKALPKTDVVFEFKCIEGWSQVTHWGGVRFSDFAKKYHLGTRSGQAPDKAHPSDLANYVGLVTPDGGYYVGIDMPSALHPQTILCYEMNGKPLPMNQGAPLRLIIPIKYGIKSLKRIGTIFFSDTRPRDYWAEHGYDYDAAL